MGKILPIYLPIAYLFNKGWDSNADETDVVNWKKTEKSKKIGKTNLLTGGGILLTLIGGLSSLFSKGKSTFSSLLTLIGLGAVGFGLLTGPDFSGEEGAEKAPPSDKNVDNNPKQEGNAIIPDNGTEKPNPKEKSKINEYLQELKKFQDDELIAILVNSPKQKENNIKRRGTAAVILADRKVKEAIEPLVNCLKENMKTLVPKIKKALSKIGLNEAYREIVIKGLAKLVRKDNSKLGENAFEIRKNAAVIILDILKDKGKIQKS